MKKQDIERAVRDRWTVQDEFGAKGTVVSLHSAEQIKVAWEWEPNAPAAIVHYTKVERA